MKKTGIKIHNKFLQNLEIRMEPEGNIFDLPINEHLVIILREQVEDAIEIEIGNAGSKPYFTIWPLNSEYEVFFRGNEVY